MTDQIHIISREEWKATSPRYAFEKHYPDKVTVHHIEKPFKYGFKEFSSIRSIQRMYQDRLYAKDMPFHVIISPIGNIYQGLPFDVLGNHVKSNNNGNIGIALIGNMEIEEPSQNQIKSLKQTLEFIKIKYPQLDLPRQLYGHKDFADVECPGQNLYSLIFAIKTMKETLYHMESEVKGV